MVKVTKKNKAVVKETKLVNDIESDQEQNVSALPTTDTDVENEDPRHPIQEKAMMSAIQALLQLINIRKDGEKKKALFNDESKAIILQIVPIKIPNSHRQEIRIPLPHRLAPEGSDVCLITTDVKKSTKNNHEPTIAYYKSLLEEKNIKGITEIVPIRQLRSEYIPYEMKGRFASLYDLYLVDGRLYGKVTKFLGTRFFRKNKPLIPVKINTKHVKKRLESALSKTVLSVHGLGNCFAVKVGYSHFSESQLKENMMEIAVVLAAKFPGGFDNIRSLRIKCHGSKALPIFLSTKWSNEVPVPVVNPKLPKAYQPVEGELSTVVGSRVTVLPTGEVRVKRDYTQEDIEMGYGKQTMRKRPEEEEEEMDDEEEEDDDGDDDEDMELDVKPAKGKKRKATAADGDSSDDDVEAAEDAYMMGMQNQANAVGKTEKKAKPTPKLKPAKAKKEVTKKNKLQQVGAEKGHGTPGLKATPKAKSAKLKTDPHTKTEAGKIGVSPKKLKISPKVKPMVVKPKGTQGEMVSPKKLKPTPKVGLEKAKSKLQSQKKGEDTISPKKLKATPKVKPGKSSSEPQFEIETEEIISPKKLKATPKVKPGKTRKDPEPDEMGLQDMINQLFASEHEDLEVPTDQPVKSKKTKNTVLQENSTPKTRPRGLVRAATEPRDDKAKSKLDKAVKLKKSKRLQDLSATPVDKKTKPVGAGLGDFTPNASLKSPSITKKQSKTKEAKKEEKTGQETPLSSKDKVRPARKSFPRYFSNENQKLLS